MVERLIGLIWVFAPLSLLSFGGGSAIIPEIEHRTVSTHHWLGGQQFADLFGLSRAAPGPSTLLVALIGWQVAGLLGAVVAAVSIFLPSSLLTLAAGTWWSRNADTPVRDAIERGLAPVAVGLFFAGPLVILRSAHAGRVELATTAAVCAVLTVRRISPYYVAAAVVALYLLVYLVLGAGAL